MELRDYQKTVIQEVYNKWDSGLQNIGVQLATGGGKTVLFSKIISDHNGYAIAIAHRIELVSQISLTLARYGIRHNIIAQKQAIREIVSLHLEEFKKNYYDPHAKKIVAGVDTLLRLPETTPWFQHVTLVIQDEAHHVLKKNKWGKAASLFPKARGFYPTATPVRADGYGLGQHADGVLDTLVLGPSMRDLIREGYLTDYRIFAPPSDIDLTEVPIAASGDFSAPKLRTAVHKSHITGDVVEHYLKIAKDQLGVTFAVDIEAATEITTAFKSQGVPAEVVSGKTPDLLRSHIMRRFRNREILQIVNVDLLGEGVDVPAISCVSFARPTASFSLYSQQFGRALRPMPGKTHAIIIDHVSNVMRHGLPDAYRAWSLDRRERRSRSQADDVEPLKTCLNLDCFSVYSRVYKSCPFCGHYTPPAQRSSPKQVDGDLTELDPDVLSKLRGEIDSVYGAPKVPQYLDRYAQAAIIKRHDERKEIQKALRSNIAQWAGYLKLKNYTDSEMYRQFYITFGIDVATAQTLNIKNTEELNKRVIDDMDRIK